LLRILSKHTICWANNMTDQRNLPLYILARHRLAFRSLERTLAAHLWEIRPFDQSLSKMTHKDGWILVLDTQSVEEWPALVSQSKLNGGRSIIVAHKAPESSEEEIRLLYLGIYGIVPSERAEDDLPKAVSLVCEGGLWVSRDALAQYVRQTEDRSASRCFTGREQQIIVFLMKGFSNKEIGASLDIAERTVKFHVSNILHKLNVDNRKKLQEQLMQNANSLIEFAA
jgi:DNA-binding NarL/FixJ family response regulator